MQWTQHGDQPVTGELRRLPATITRPSNWPPVAVLARADEVSTLAHGLGGSEVGSSAVFAGLRPLGPKIVRASKPLGSWWRVSLRLRRRRRVHGTDLATITVAFIALGLTAAEPRDFRAADTQSKDHPTARALVHMSDLVRDRTP